ncbi:HAD superfamily hydrolase (TIGR01509 family) [Streptomyces zagrosensis]|uniref:HAD superfamily hydrolase (TIGR01509 family) n=2 Tax=Streptomyces zagrosensis TaxID=1042984 RepID=A0A7W9UYL8_9ACTN|nr:HAD family phosphatase [Streptomyces zagrosensis]MBB5935491.1 HAD superfamily hydrolase (TIGR01509 family) [Streptomyces zagrosensis]
MTENSLFSWSPAAVVFDCDGTLMDTESHWQDARWMVLRDFGITPAAGFAERAKGMHYTACGQLMADEAGKPYLGEDLARGLLEHFTARVAENPVTMPGAVGLVRLLSPHMPLAVASNCPRDTVESGLGRARLLDHFQHIVVPGDGLRAKPWPDVYAAAANLCGVECEQALAVEDSLTGVEAARRAGMRVLGVGQRPAGGGATRADLWVHSLQDLDLVDWLRTQVQRQ